MDDVGYVLHYMSNLNILHYSQVPECTARVDKQYAGYCVLQLMTSGGIDLSYDARKYRLEGCWFFTSSPGPHTTFHTAPGYDSWSHRHIAFTGPQVQHWQADGLFFHEPQAGDAGRHGAAFDRLLAAVQAPGHLANRLAANLLEHLLLDLAEERTSLDGRDPWLEAVLAKLDGGVGKEVDYSALARRLGMSVSTLRRRFQHATGMTIHNYVIETRVAAAREQLQYSPTSIKEIADQLGYRDVYFFSRQFKQRVGLSPAAFRHSL
jgi:AraC family transcriptional regulator of arabinose operon